MTLIREERETILRTSDADDHWAISTASPKFIRKLQKLSYQNDDDVLWPSVNRLWTSINRCRASACWFCFFHSRAKLIVARSPLVFVLSY